MIDMTKDPHEVAKELMKAYYDSFGNTLREDDFIMPEMEVQQFILEKFKANIDENVKNTIERLLASIPEIMAFAHKSAKEMIELYTNDAVKIAVTAIEEPLKKNIDTVTNQIVDQHNKSINEIITKINNLTKNKTQTYANLKSINKTNIILYFFNGFATALVICSLFFIINNIIGF